MRRWTCTVYGDEGAPPEVQAVEAPGAGEAVGLVAVRVGGRAWARVVAEKDGRTWWYEFDACLGWVPCDSPERAR